MRLNRRIRLLSLIACGIFAAAVIVQCGRQQTKPEAKRAQTSQARSVNLPTTKRLDLPAPGHPQKTNSFPTALALGPDGQYVAILNNGFGTEESSFKQSIAVLSLSDNHLADFPDNRLGRSGQTYFLGLAFGRGGRHLYASMSSLTDPTGKKPGDTGNGIAVYNFDNGSISPEGFLKIGLQHLHANQHPTTVSKAVPRGDSDPYPAGLALVRGAHGDELLVADNLSDNALLVDGRTGRVLHRFDLSRGLNVPATFPYATAATRDGQIGFCSLWNASAVAELDLQRGRVRRWISLMRPSSPTAPGSHPSAMLLSPDEHYLYVTLSNFDRVAVIDVARGKVAALLSTELPGEKYGGTYPNGLAQTPDGKELFVADAGVDAVAVYHLDPSSWHASGRPSTLQADGFIPTEWYPTAVAVHNGSLLIASGKGEGTKPNAPMARSAPGVRSKSSVPYQYIATLIHGSVASIGINDLEGQLPALTKEVESSNWLMRNPPGFHFTSGHNPIKHVIYIIKENRTYDQIFGDLKPGNGDPSLVMYGWKITPNEHKLAQQFGILDDFYCSGEVSGNGHVWSMAAIDSDYTEKTWEIAYRGRQRTYDYQGQVLNGFPLAENIPDVDEPGTGYIWTNVAKHGLTHRNYAEFVSTHWCDQKHTSSPMEGTPLPAGESCPKAYVDKGQPLPSNVGDPHGSASPWPWPIPMIAKDQATMPELQGHFDPRYADFRLDYPDQLRMDEFMNEFRGFVKARETGHGTELPQFVILRMPDDHTAGTRPHMPKPEASIADNDLAVGRVVDAVSHSPYWDDTAICILEDDAQDGPDHVDAHRSTALVISKYSPSSMAHPVVDHHFYTTVNMVRTMEALLGLPPMNLDDARAGVITLFSGNGDQPAFNADYQNKNNGLIYEENPPRGPGARESAKMDFTHADAVNSAELNAILWKERRGNVPMPAPRHTVFSVIGGEHGE